MPSLADSAASSASSTTTPLPVASVGPPVSGPPLCPPDESVLESLVAVLVAAIIFLAALVLAVLLFACSSQQSRREQRCSHDHHNHHHCKRRRRRTSQEVRSRAKYCCSNSHDLLEDVEQYRDGHESSATPVGGAPRRFDYGSSGRSSSPDAAAKKSPYHPGYNSPATTSKPSAATRRREGFRMASYASRGAHSDLAPPALHSTMFQSSVSHQRTRERRAEAAAAGTANPPSGDTSDSSRHSGQTCVETGSDTHSLEWDNFQQPLAAAATPRPSSSEPCTEDSFSIAATDGSHQQQHRRPLYAQSQHWV
ncbi:uncharacterized protein LOC119432350 [Dermacentor silvarum]|uniref:uncharacterized protein LOC119432350 n=1 Tax=Dermacentor silvarum TaxID=543639 RepID=UPI0018973237|nr:uncharacterized protein LOC119432350 [Dermacentor silvarum]